MKLTEYQGYIHKSRYARWLEEENRRETWPETVDRYIKAMQKQIAKKTKHRPVKLPWGKIRKAILNMDVMPSMRAMMTAGLALERDNIAGYNCSYLAIDNPRAFDEILYILMCGTGVGFSVESEYVNKLPVVPEQLHSSNTVLAVADSRVGWASALRELIALLYAGKIPKWDLSKLRPGGSRLRVFGGRSSGPAPLDRLFRITVELFTGAAGRRLTTVEAHDLVCHIADAVIVGGVRRSALISLSDLGDMGMAKAKTGQWWVDHPHRALANNSAVYDGFCSFDTFLTEWKNLYDSKSGERGIFNRMASRKQAQLTGRRDPEHKFGTNPCGEIILRSMGLCNLTEVVIRPNDTPRTLKTKVKIATILGTIQSTFTDFRYVRNQWQKNAEEERLLGVSLTGIFDNLPLVHKKGVLSGLKKDAIATNKRLANSLRIAASAAITCIKPSGTVSQLALCSSGIHPSFSPFYIRRVRGDNKDPITSFLKAVQVPSEPEKFHPESVTVFSFPTKCPEGAATSKDINALEHYEVYKFVRENWCEHNPSTTIYYSEKEFLALGQRVWEDFQNIGGLSFLPRADHIYEQAPYEEITEEKYKELKAKMPVVDWEAAQIPEVEDTTIASQELACHGNVCEL